MDVNAETLSCVVFGDPQNVNSHSEKIVNRVIAERPDLCVIVGDMVNDAGDEAQWRRITGLIDPLREVCPVYAIPGNHDYHPDGSVENFLNFSHSPGNNTHFSLEKAGFCFLFADSVGDAAVVGDPKATGPKLFEHGGCDTEGEHYRWLSDCLQKATAEKKSILLFHHHPVFLPTNVYFCTSPTVRVDATVAPPALGDLLPLLIRYPPEMMFSGHLHTYEHSAYGGIDFVTTGASSYGLWKMAGTANGFRVNAEERYHYCRLKLSATDISLEAVDEDGICFDSWQRLLRP